MPIKRTENNYIDQIYEQLEYYHNHVDKRIILPNKNGVDSGRALLILFFKKNPSHPIQKIKPILQHPGRVEEGESDKLRVDLLRTLNTLHHKYPNHPQESKINAFVKIVESYISIREEWKNKVNFTFTLSQFVDKVLIVQDQYGQPNSFNTVLEDFKGQDTIDLTRKQYEKYSPHYSGRFTKNILLSIEIGHPGDMSKVAAVPLTEAVTTKNSLKKTGFFGSDLDNTDKESVSSDNSSDDGRSPKK